MLFVTPIANSTYANAFLGFSLLALVHYAVPCVALWFALGFSYDMLSQMGIPLLLLQLFPAAIVWTITWGTLACARAYACGLAAAAVAVPILAWEYLQTAGFVWSLIFLIAAGPIALYALCRSSYTQRLIERSLGR